VHACLHELALARADGTYIPPPRTDTLSIARLADEARVCLFVREMRSITHTATDPIICECFSIVNVCFTTCKMRSIISHHPKRQQVNLGNRHSFSAHAQKTLFGIEYQAVILYCISRKKLHDFLNLLDFSTPDCLTATPTFVSPLSRAVGVFGRSHHGAAAAARWQ
jgi:hypothetical protein